MKVRNILAALSALVVVCTAGVSVASDQDVYESLPLPYGDLLSVSDRAQVKAQSDEVGRQTISTPGRIEGTVLEGNVAAIDYERGQLIVDTDQGLLRFTTDPQNLEGVQVGDMIQVALLGDDQSE